jgi:RND family efflux transporter MFP subunit
MKTSSLAAPVVRTSLGVALLAALAACGDPPPPPQPPPQVTTARVIARDVEQTDEFTGRLEAVDAVEVKPRVSGYVQRVAFTEGAEVRRGDVLFEIDPRPYQVALERAAAELQRVRTRAALAKSEVERAAALVERQAISREEFDTRTSAQQEAEATIRAAEAAVATARLDLEWTRVRAPIAGRIGRAEVTVGNLVQSGPPAATRLTTIVSLDPIYLTFDADEQSFLKYASRNARGARRVVLMGLANESDYPHRGELDFVDNQLDPTTGTIRTRAVFSNKDRTLAPGLFARVRLVDGTRERTALVRDAAIGTDQDRKFVLVVKPDGSTEYRAVRLGPVVDGLRAVTSGLTDGERIVVNGLQRVRPGMKVRVAEEPMVPPAAPASTVASVR